MIVKQIVLKAGGNIHVKSDGAGKGSSFILYMKMQAMHDPMSSYRDNNLKISLQSQNRDDYSNTKSD